MVAKTAITILQRFEILVPSARWEGAAEKKRYYSTHLSH